MIPTRASFWNYAHLLKTTFLFSWQRFKSNKNYSDIPANYSSLLSIKENLWQQSFQLSRWLRYLFNTLRKIVFQGGALMMCFSRFLFCQAFDAEPYILANAHDSALPSNSSDHAHGFVVTCTGVSATSATFNVCRWGGKLGRGQKVEAFNFLIRYMYVISSTYVVTCKRQKFVIFFHTSLAHCKNTNLMVLIF